MDDPRIPAPGGDLPEIADAASLFQDAPRSSARPAPAAPSPSAGDDPGPSDAYEVEDHPEPTSTARPRASSGSARPSTQAARPSKPQATPSTARPVRDPSAAVTQVWTRGAEWTGTLILLAVVGAGVLFLAYMLISFEQYGLAFLVLLLGGPALVGLSYPILITLERPVRITPEHAVRDYYAALSHHVPHYRRMWLLLSDAGRVSASFASFEGFRVYWKARRAELRSGRASRLTPLTFRVDDFQSAKSAGKDEIEAKFTIKVLIRGRHAEGPIESIPVVSTLVKGPDRMWYLDRGTLP